MTASRPLVIVGAGPAGLAAAIEAARAGLPCTLLDESPHLGGRIYRRPPEVFQVQDPEGLGRDFARRERLRAEFAEVADRVEVLRGTSVLGIWEGPEVLWATGDASGLLRPERLILAPGAYDRPVPLPGWTLPGVMTAGGVQTLLKAMRTRPGRQALVAGTGPLLLSVAHRLHEAGVEIVAALEAGSPSWQTGAFPSEWGEWDFLQDAQGDLEGLTRARVPILFNHTVFDVQGRDGVERASYGPIDPEDWRPVKDRARSVDVDLVVLGFGFIPDTHLTVLAGCRHEYVPERGGWVPVRDERMETTVPGLFAIGDGAGVMGVQAALEQGRIAGITAAEWAGALSDAEAATRRAGPLERLRVLAELHAALSQTSRIRPGLIELIAPETPVCRCEEMTLAEVRAAVDAGAKDLQAVKLGTRLGMGPCQGRNCAPAMGMFLSQVTGRLPEEIGRINPRPPAKPVTLGALARMGSRPGGRG
ncbi:FAD/NAD(P)-dependent oxidoreductase [Tautonia sociabilis]|nr:NAD(P)/FAD-dependent oxidoreductase [Tautonia sociabilis]